MISSGLYYYDIAMTLLLT